MVSLARLRHPASKAETSGSRSPDFVETSFVELADDLTEVADLAAGFSERLRRRGVVMLRHRRHLHGDSLDLIEQHLRTLIAAYDAVSRDARELRADTRARDRTSALLAGLTRERAGCADRLRTIGGIAGSTMVASEWQSPSFAHALRSNAGTWTDAVRPHVDDYRRDRHPDAAAFEEAFLGAYVERADRDVRALTTSCGMSAFATILGFLLMERKFRGPVILGRSAYHECRDLVRSLVPRETLIEVGEHPPDALAAAIARHRPAVVFLDSVGNAPGVLVPDLTSVVRAMRETDLEPHLVLDNTALSCALQPFQLPLARRVHLLVFESLTKYAQFGLDRVTGGVILAEERDADALDRYREHMGTNIADASVHGLPWPDRVRLERRLDRIGRNAVTLAAAITRAAEDTGRRVVVAADHPGLDRHPSYSATRDLAFRGGWLSIAFSPTHDRPDIHHRFVELAIEEARRRQVPLIAGATFGLDVTRIYPTASTARSTRPFVRVSPGIEHLAQIEELGAALRGAVTRLASESPVAASRE